MYGDRAKVKWIKWWRSRRVYYCTGVEIHGYLLLEFICICVSEWVSECVGPNQLRQLTLFPFSSLSLASPVNFGVSILTIYRWGECTDTQNETKNETNAFAAHTHTRMHINILQRTYSWAHRTRKRERGRCARKNTTYTALENDPWLSLCVTVWPCVTGCACEHCVKVRTIITIDVERAISLPLIYMCAVSGAVSLSQVGRERKSHSLKCHVNFGYFCILVISWVVSSYAQLHSRLLSSFRLFVLFTLLLLLLSFCFFFFFFSFVHPSWSN